MPSPSQTDQFDASDFKALKVEISNLNANMQRLSGIIEQNTKQLSKIEVLEANHNHQSQGLDRAFTAINEVEESLKQHERDDVVAHDAIAKQLVKHAEANEKEHAAYNKYIYLSIGFVTAVCMFWTLFGTRLNNIVDENIRDIAALKASMAVEQGISNRDRPHSPKNTNGGEP